MTAFPFKSIGGPGGVWPHPSSIEYSAYVRNAAATAGDLLMQDYAASDGETSTAGLANIAASTHIMANVLAPTSAGLQIDSGGPYFGVAVRSVAENSLVRLLLFGYVSAFVEDDTDSVAIGDPLIGDTAKNLDGGAAVGGARILAQAQEAMTTPTTRTLGEVLMNGVSGFCTGFYYTP